LRVGEQTLFGEQVDIQQADSKADINNKGRNNALPADGPHFIKIKR
jgi:hypothetical protein